LIAFHYTSRGLDITKFSYRAIDSKPFSILLIIQQDQTALSESDKEFHYSKHGHIHYLLFSQTLLPNRTGARGLSSTLWSQSSQRVLKGILGPVRYEVCALPQFHQ
jgi:hypothetical protein